jgi:replicative DNA helicase
MSSGLHPHRHGERRARAAAHTPPVADRLPPHSAEAEQGVLGCVLLSPNECLPVCLEKLGAGATAFYDLRHQEIYRMMVTMFDKREPVEMILLHQRLKDNGTLDQIGGIAYLNEIQDCVPSAANLSYYLDEVAKRYTLRRMIHVCTGVVQRAYEFDGELEPLLDEVERDVLRLAEDRVSGEQKNIKALVNQAIGTVENYFNRQGQISGLPTGFADLDRMTDGLHGGEMIVIAARPSMGKTSLAMNIAEHVVLNHVWTEETDDEHRAAAARAEGLKVTEV